MSLIFNLALGALIGWLASKIMGGSSSLLRNILVGLVGSGVGSFVAGLFGISAIQFSVGGILISVLGACLCIWLVRKFVG
ncbi:MAG: GlsB/YeaQ/YmgE family stress response membrane protein [Gemmiger sp.]|nr:GlsB/YeaQ/YmgE family stress response membrane protein [Gemmiger sp.]